MSVLIAVGLLVMMDPVLAKVRYTDTGTVLRDRRLMVALLVINWLLAPAFTFDNLVQQLRRRVRRATIKR